jgi:hypothetical protein
MLDQPIRLSQPKAAPVARPTRSVELPQPADPVASQAALAQMTGYWDWEV